MKHNILFSSILIFVAAGCYIKEGDKSTPQAVPVPVTPAPPVIIQNNPGPRHNHIPPRHHHRPPFSLEIEINKGKGGDHHHREDHKK